MTNRLPYETKGGALSSAETFKQMLELLRLAEEDARLLGNLCRLRGDVSAGESWTKFAANFSQIFSVTVLLAQSKVNSSVGFDG